MKMKSSSINAALDGLIKAGMNINFNADNVSEIEKASGEMPNGFIDIRSPESPSVLLRLRHSPRKAGWMTTVGRTSVEVLQKWETYWPSEVKSLPKNLAPILGDFEPD